MPYIFINVWAGEKWEADSIKWNSNGEEGVVGVVLGEDGAKSST